MKRFILAIFMTLFMATLAMATAYDVTKGGTTGIPANAPGPYVLEYYINADAANAGAGYGAGDTLKFMAVPAGAVVYGVQVEIDTAEGAACTFDVGDSASATGYFSNVDANNATVDSAILTYGASAPKYYAATDDLLITFDSATTDAFKGWVRVIFMPFKQ